MKLVIPDDFTKRIADHMLKGKNYYYYSLSFKVYGEDNFKVAMYFLNQLEDYPLSLFDSITITIDKCDNEDLNKFIEVYTAKGFDLSKINTNIHSLRNIGKKSKSLRNGVEVAYMHLVNKYKTFCKIKSGYELNVSGFVQLHSHFEDLSGLKFKALTIDPDNVEDVYNNINFLQHQECTVLKLYNKSISNKEQIAKINDLLGIVQNIRTLDITAIQKLEDDRLNILYPILLNSDDGERFT